jgi:hypothetical protein
LLHCCWKRGRPQTCSNLQRRLHNLPGHHRSGRNAALVRRADSPETNERRRRTAVRSIAAAAITLVVLAVAGHTALRFSASACPLSILPVDSCCSCSRLTWSLHDKAAFAPRRPSRPRRPKTVPMWPFFPLAVPPMDWLRVSGINVVGRVFGIVLAAFAVQYVLDGVTEVLTNSPVI